MTHIGPLLYEKHRVSCTCSYCNGQAGLRYGFNVPAAWRNKHSWYAVKIGRGKYIRFTRLGLWLWLRRSER